MAKANYPRLAYFFSAYFHDSWEVTHNFKGANPSFKIVVRDFRDLNPRAIVTKAIQELEHLIQQNLSETELCQVMNRDLGSAIYAADSSVSYQARLEAILNLLKGGK